MNYYILIPVLMISSLMGCKSNDVQQIDQGISGKVLWHEGNFMPGPDKEPKSGEPAPRKVYIYELTPTEAAVRNEHFFIKVKSKLVKIVQTDENGNFDVSLPPGRYSLFTKEEEGLFASTFDGEGNINPATVTPGKTTEITIDINYKATY